jgi:mersacidin/lichenicidin family type 2 lantibiotic
MNIATVVRAWKDREYRLGLTDEERALLPENPAGLLELDDADLAQVAGGRKKKGSNSGGGRSRSRSRGRS